MCFSFLRRAGFILTKSLKLSVTSCYKDYVSRTKIRGKSGDWAAQIPEQGSELCQSITSATPVETNVKWNPDCAASDPEPWAAVNQSSRAQLVFFNLSQLKVMPGRGTGSEQMVLYILSNKSVFFWTMVYSINSSGFWRAPGKPLPKQDWNFCSRSGWEPGKNKRRRMGTGYESLQTMVRFSYPWGGEGEELGRKLLRLQCGSKKASPRLIGWPQKLPRRGIVFRAGVIQHCTLAELSVAGVGAGTASVWRQ